MINRQSDFPHAGLACLPRVARRFVAGSFLMLAGCSTVPDPVSEYEASEQARSNDVQLRYSGRIQEALQREDWQGARAVTLEQARAHATQGQPLARADALRSAAAWTARLKRDDEAQALLREALQVLDAVDPGNRLDQEWKDYYAIDTRLRLADLLLAEPKRRLDAQALVDAVRKLCSVARGKLARASCNSGEQGGHLYDAVLARLGDPAAGARVQQRQAEEAVLDALRPYAERFAASRERGNHAGVVRFGAELSAQLARRQHVGGGFLAPLVEFDRAQAFRLQGDVASADATLHEARRQLAGGLLDLSKLWLDRESDTAEKIGLAAYARQLRGEGAIVVQLDSLQGLNKGLSDNLADPRSLLDTRSKLARSADQLQSRGAPFSAEYARQRMREVSVAYQKRVAEVSAERAALARMRAEDDARDRAGWDHLRDALAYTAGVLGKVSQVNGGSAVIGVPTSLPGTSAAATTPCRCGSDYVQCLAREAQRTGARYQISPDGRNIVYLRPDGSWSAKRGLNSDGKCGAIAN